VIVVERLGNEAVVEVRDVEVLVAAEALERDAADVEFAFERGAPDVDLVPRVIAAVDAEQVARGIAREEVQRQAPQQLAVELVIARIGRTRQLTRVTSTRLSEKVGARPRPDQASDEIEFTEPSERLSERQ
jgi:hypothetical protein